VETILKSLCDRVDVADDGKVSLHGMIDQLTVASFPATHGNLGIAVKVEYTAAEVGREVAVNLDLLTEDGGKVTVPNIVKRELPPPTAAGRPASWTCAFNLPSLTFPAPGRYQFVIRMNSRVVAELPLFVSQAE
jgi:hypothetical protein